MFSGELEVDGDLTVTGNIQSQTIDSLLQIIENLESQILALSIVPNFSIGNHSQNLTSNGTYNGTVDSVPVIANKPVTFIINYNVFKNSGISASYFELLFSHNNNEISPISIDETIHSLTASSQNESISINYRGYYIPTEDGEISVKWQHSANGNSNFNQGSTGHSIDSMVIY
tara:strand:- start:273 stop:791 length:519 start_codon:yes stop_codon:yes gene_type:complete